MFVFFPCFSHISLWLHFCQHRLYDHGCLFPWLETKLPFVPCSLCPANQSKKELSYFKLVAQGADHFGPRILVWFCHGGEELWFGLGPTGHLGRCGEIVVLFLVDGVCITMVLPKVGDVISETLEGYITQTNPSHHCAAGGWKYTSSALTCWACDVWTVEIYGCVWMYIGVYIWHHLILSQKPNGFKLVVVFER